ncbi:PREDICTED: uncharacterized protein LOC109233784 [Nicotiana attenuata]|uniref:uncharacterized protein LOC109233784 n=1 Tax=Nicotiana attenuata TaxID=49451 RepID=UPI0009052E7C|nr:PREDICTED: uncharacterized protein LOC109233784 [Nicotiana attenuata]
MYDRNHPNHTGLRDEFIERVASFIVKAKTLDDFLIDGIIRCPYMKCKCLKLLRPDSVTVHLYKKGFMKNYYVWTVHGEIHASVDDVHFENSFGGEEGSRTTENINVENYRFNEMKRDAFPEAQSEPNDEAKSFFKQLEEASCPLYEGATHSKLSVAVRLLSIKLDNSISQAGMDSIIGLMNELNPTKIDLPKDFYTAKKVVSKLGLSSERIDYCEKGCMLFYKEDSASENCEFCNQPRYKEVTNAKQKKVPVKAMHYLPLVPRLKRLCASMSFAHHMRWHYEHRRPDGVLCHPSDGEAWKHFDRAFPDFAGESRNIRLGLCADGFTPFTVSAAPYSCTYIFSGLAGTAAWLMRGLRPFWRFISVSVLPEVLGFGIDCYNDRLWEDSRFMLRVEVIHKKGDSVGHFFEKGVNVLAEPWS